MLPWDCQYTVIILKHSSPKSNIKHFLKHFFYNDAFEVLINVNSKQTPFVSQFMVKPVQNSFITSCQGSSKLCWKPVVLLLFSRLVFYIFYHLQLVEETCYENRQTPKLKTTVPKFMLEAPRPCTILFKTIVVLLNVVRIQVQKIRILECDKDVCRVS